MEASPSSGPYWMHWNAFEDVVAITWATAAAPQKYACRESSRSSRSRLPGLCANWVDLDLGMLLHGLPTTSRSREQTGGLKDRGAGLRARHLGTETQAYAADS